MMTYRVLFSDRFLLDIQESKKWYNQQQKGLGKKFYSEVKSGLKSISKSPYFQVRYDEVHCLPLEKYPFMIHYTIDEANKTIFILACIHCSLNPHNHWLNE